jgi:four helix bundle protein
MQKEETDLRERTKAFALRIVRMFSALPKTTEAQVLGKQLLRSGISIGANYREAFPTRSKAEFIAKCGDSLREIEEWSVLVNRDIDGRTREVAGELLGSSESKRLLAGTAGGIRSCQRG